MLVPFPLVFCAYALWLVFASYFTSSNFLANAGWKDNFPSNAVIPRSSQRNHVFYVGQPVMFQLGGDAARYSVRDYWGNVVEQGAAKANVTLQVREPGWYKLYVYGDQKRQPWGEMIGGTTFVIFRDDPNFPKATPITPPAASSPSQLGQLKLSRIDTNVDFDWGEGAPGGGLASDNFRVRWSGFVRPRYSETYRFWTLADDGVRLWVNDQLLIDDWKEHGPIENQGTITLDAAKPYRLRLEYFEKGFGAVVKLGWASRSQQKTVIAGEFLSPVAVFSNARGLKAEYFVAAVEGRTDGIDAAYYPSMDPVMRNVTGMGPQRHFVEDAGKPEEAIRKLERAIAYDKATYLNYDPLRQRALMIAFPNGTQNSEGVKRIVRQFRNDVKYWEPRNEPNGNTSGAAFAHGEMKSFYEDVKSVDTTLKVLGPGTVTIGPNSHGLEWIEDFLRAGGGRYIDAFSFHAYNNVNGDVWLARHSLNSLQSLLRKYGLENIEKWQTEQGYFSAMYGAYLPRHQGHWTMVQMMVFEQYGIPKEHNHYWYDKSHGFWDHPTFWQNDDESLNPAAPLLRVWSEELYGTTYTRAFDFGDPGNKMYIGSLFEGPGKKVAAFMSAGTPNGQIELNVAGGTALRVISAFGVVTPVPIVAGKVRLAVPELPVYVELAANQTISVTPLNRGRNLAANRGVKAVAQGATVHPHDRAIPNDISKIHNGRLENWYWGQTPPEQPWMSNVTTFPAWVELRLPARTSIGRMVVYAAPPWQMQSTLLNYELQWDDNGQWKTIERVNEPNRTHTAWTPVTRTCVDSYFSGRWIFEHAFKPVTTQKIRLLVHDVTWGGGATREVVEAGGQTGPHQIVLREIEMYAR
jgi:hypothetical protein